jgi:hypothetical protein
MNLFHYVFCTYAIASGGISSQKNDQHLSFGCYTRLSGLIIYWSSVGPFSYQFGFPRLPGRCGTVGKTTHAMRKVDLLGVFKMKQMDLKWLKRASTWFNVIILNLDNLEMIRIDLSFVGFNQSDILKFQHRNPFLNAPNWSSMFYTDTVFGMWLFPKWFKWHEMTKS